MNNQILVWQIVFAILTGWIFYQFICWIKSKMHAVELVALRQRISNWPNPAPRIWLIFVPFMSTAQRWARPSAKLSKALSATGDYLDLDAREFAVFRNALSLLVVACAGMVSCAGLLLLNFSPAFSLALPALSGVLTFFLLTSKTSDRYKVIQRQVSRNFPSFLDVLSLTLESGKNFQSALQLAAQQLPAAGSSAGLRAQLQELIRDTLASGSKTLALQRFSERLAIPEVVQFSAAVIAAERQGVSVAALLRRQAEQLRTSQALAAERHAMKLPVKLLAPLAICIFPCTFLVLAFPLAIRLSGSGLF